MTVSTTTSRVSYPGTGSAGPFSFTFRIFDEDDLVLVREDSDGVETTLVLTDDYTVTGVGDRAGGTVTLEDALAVGETLTIARSLDLTQETSLTTQGGAYFPEDVEAALDRQTMIAQQQQRELDDLAEAVDASETTDLAGLTAIAGDAADPDDAVYAIANTTSAGRKITLGGLMGALRRFEGVFVATAPEFGAVADSATDNADAIGEALAAAAAAGGGVVLLPAASGYYHVASTLTVPEKVRLLGLGNYRYGHGTKLRYTGAGTAVSVAGQNGVGDLLLYTTTGATGILADGVNCVTLDGVAVQGFSTYQLFLDDAFWVRARLAHFQGPDGSVGCYSSANFNQVVFDTCGFTCEGSGAWTAIDVAGGGSGSAIHGCDFDQGAAVTYGLIRIRDGMAGIAVTASRFETQGARALYFHDNAFGLHYAGNFFTSADSLPDVDHAVIIDGGDATIEGSDFVECTNAVQLTASSRRCMLANISNRTPSGTRWTDGGTGNVKLQPATGDAWPAIADHGSDAKVNEILAALRARGLIGV